MHQICTKRGLFVLFAGFCLLILVPAAYGAIGYSGDVGAYPAASDPNTWTSATSGYIGNTGDGSVTVDGGSDLTSSFSILGVNSGVTGEVTVAGAGSTWTNGEFHVGGNGHGILKILEGAYVSTGRGGVGGDGNFTHGTGEALVSGIGSAWSCSTLDIGYWNNGTLNVTEGGCVTTAICAIGGDYGSTGIMTVDGVGSSLSVASTSISAHFRVGTVRPLGGGKLYITNGGRVTSNASIGFVGADAGGHGFVLVDGTGSTWTNSGDVQIGCGGVGVLNIDDGGLVTAASIAVSSYSGPSVLAIDVGNDSALKVGAGSGTITNNGTVRIVAGAKPEAYGAYSPISAGKWTTGAYGVYQAIGGKWNTDLHEFTVSGVREADSGETIGNLDLNTTQRVRIDYDTTALHWTLGASFLAQNATLGLTATATTDLSALEGMLAEGETVFGAWNLLFTSGYAEGDPAYLSFDVGAKHSRDDFKVWRYTGGAWTAFDAGDLSYDGHYANFTVTGFSGYALTGTMVPEPGTLGMALAMGAALAGYCWWRRKVYNL